MYHDQRLKVFLTFCFVYGRIGHQLKDYEDLNDSGVEGFNEIKENDLS